jgi:TRAP-type uncharacterized transport system substrate-binding protein
MNLSIIVFIFILAILYNIQGNIFKKITYINEYIIGITNNNNIKKFMELFLNILDKKLKLKVKIYDTNKEMLMDLNDHKINFAITNENNVLESILGINSYSDLKLQNINFTTGLFYNYQYFLTDIFYKDTKKTIEIQNVHDLKYFYKVYNRHFVIGTEEKKSDSFTGLLVLLYMYGFNPVDINKKKKNEKYSENTIFYSALPIDKLLLNFTKNLLDGVFLINIHNYNKIRETIDIKDVLFLNITFKKTIFNDIYSNFYYNKTMTISNYNEDLDTTYSFKTKTNRIVLITHKNEDEKVVEKLMKTYYIKNNYLINKLFGNTNISKDHNTFEPLDMIYVNKYINIHKGSYNYMKELGFILNEGTRKQISLNNNETFDHYWKYDKIGLDEFNLI